MLHTKNVTKTFIYPQKIILTYLQLEIGILKTYIL